MTKPKVYVETTVFGYLTAKRSRDIIVAAHQQVTQEWWEQRRQHFDLFVSQIVTQEASAGDQEAAGRRLQYVREVPMLEMREEAVALARALTEEGPVPEKSVGDALHIALAAIHGMDFLLTWNCAHIANAAMRNAITSVCRAHGYDPPVICTPEELTEE